MAFNEHKSTTPIEEKDCAATPWPVIEALEKYLGVRFILDACASRATKKAPYYYGLDGDNGGCPIADDALTADWAADLKRLANPLNDRRWDKPLYPAIWVNPPFSGASPFVDAMSKAASNGCIVVGCMKDAGDPEWYQRVEREAAFIIKFSGRIDFVRPDGTPFTRVDRKTGKTVRSGVNFATIYPVFMPFRAQGLAQIIRLPKPTTKKIKVKNVL